MLIKPIRIFARSSKNPYSYVLKYQNITKKFLKKKKAKRKGVQSCDWTPSLFFVCSPSVAPLREPLLLGPQTNSRRNESRNAIEAPNRFGFLPGGLDLLRGG